MIEAREASPAQSFPAPASAERPLVSMLLIAFNQQATIAEAIGGALAQTYQPLEILVSDDASTDATASVMRDALAGYAGPHRVKLLRNDVNLGIGAHLSRLVDQSAGELLFVAAGDDVSLPQRCERTVDAWLARGKKPDLIAAPLVDIDGAGHEHGVLVPTDLGAYKSASDWLAKRPYVVGAAQAWSRRLVDRFGPLPAGVVGEDMLMVFRAILSGGAITLTEPLVRYRRGGLSRRRRTHDAADVAERLRTNNRNALVELTQLLADARLAGQEDIVASALEARLARERFIQDLFAARTFTEHLRIAVRAAAVPLATRIRLFVYAACPALLAPFFALKRRLARRD